MALYIAEKLNLDPQDILEWHHSKLITVFGYYANNQSAENYKYWLELPPDRKKGKTPPKKYIVRFLNSTQLEEIERLRMANETNPNTRITEFFNGTK